MANSDFNLTRNQIIVEALKKIGVVNHGAVLTAQQEGQGNFALNLIMREESETNIGQAKMKWEIKEGNIFLAAGQYSYGVSDGLNSDITSLISAIYRDSAGEDTVLDIGTIEQYESLADKNDTGTPVKVYLNTDKALNNQQLRVWPALTAIATPSIVTGSDALDYTCTMGHTSSTLNKPITGTDYPLYWQQTGAGGSAWADTIIYTGGEVIRYRYKAAILDFDLSTDTLDMKQGWQRYIIFRLAYDLSPEFHLSFNERSWLKAEYSEARKRLFEATTENPTDIHNKSMFF